MAENLKEGFLKKKAEKGVVKLHKRRYFVLKSNAQLYYYIEDSSLFHKGVIDMNALQAIATESSPNSSVGNCTLILHLPRRSYTLTASTPEECAEWVQVLKVYEKGRPIRTSANRLLDGFNTSLRMSGGEPVTSYTIKCNAEQLDRKDRPFMKSDPFFVIYSSIASKTNKSPILYKSEIIAQHLSPSWEPFTVEVSKAGGIDKLIRFEIFDYDNDGTTTKIGFFECCLRRLAVTGAEFQVINPKKTRNPFYKNSGLLYVTSSTANYLRDQINQLSDNPKIKPNSKELSTSTTDLYYKENSEDLGHHDSKDNETIENVEASATAAAATITTYAAAAAATTITTYAAATATTTYAAAATATTNATATTTAVGYTASAATATTTADATATTPFHNTNDSHNNNDSDNSASNSSDSENKISSKSDSNNDNNTDSNNFSNTKSDDMGGQVDKISVDAKIGKEPSKFVRFEQSGPNLVKAISRKLTASNKVGFRSRMKSMLLGSALNVTKPDFLDFSRNRTISTAKLKAAIEDNPDIVKLNLNDVPCVRTELIEWIVQRTPHLTHLQLHWCEQLEGKKAMVAIGNHCPNLVSLSLACSSNISAKGLIAIAQKCSHLKILDISWVWDVTDEAMDVIATSLTELQELTLSGCQHLTDKTLYSLANAKLLTLIDVSRLQKLGIPAVEHLASSLPKLESLILLGIDSISPEYVKSEFMSKFPKVATGFIIK